MNAFQGDIGHLGHTGHKYASRPVAQFWPVAKMSGGGNNGNHSSPDREAFKAAFYATLNGTTQGGLSPYLFYDPPESSEGGVANYKSAWGSEDNVPYGAPGWDAHIAESTKLANAKTPGYSFAEGDEEVIRTALSKGLIKHLPARITYYSYGPGELIAIQKKDFQLLDAIEASPAHNLESLNAVDINNRYATAFAQAANERYNKASSAVQGDFMEGTLLLGAKVGTSVIAAFGGPFANASRDAAMSSKQKAAQYLAQLVSQHGDGTRVILTIDTQSDKKALLADYKPTRSFEAFILGAFPRAVHEGIIKKPYDVFRNWKLVTEFNEAERAVELIAQAKRAHSLVTEDSQFQIARNQKICITLSHKWDSEDWRSIGKAAGLDDFSFFGHGTRKLMVARATRSPDLSLLQP